METFNFEAKTKLFFGILREKEVGKILKDYNFSKVVLLIGKGSVRRSGLLDIVIESLRNSEVDFILLEGIRPNPTIQFIRENMDVVKEYKPDCILAVGGGSVIDTAKNMACAYYYDGDSFDFNLHIVEPKTALPIGVILTISASGSEMSNSCVIQDDTKNIKSGFNSDIVRPLFVIENPVLTYSVDKVQTAYGVVDILMHTLERYFGKSNDSELADGLAEGLLREVIKAGRVVINDPTNYEARKTLMIASSVSHNGYTSICKSFKMPIHQLEHVVSAIYPEVAHAAGLAVIWPAWAKTYLEYDLDKFDKLSMNVFNSFMKDKRQNALYGIQCLISYFKELDMPLSFKDLGIEDPNIELMVELFSKGGTRMVDHHIQPLDKEIARKIYEDCL